MLEDYCKNALELPEAPVFTPTEEQWANPFEYIESIREQAEAYGMCKVGQFISQT